MWSYFVHVPKHIGSIKIGPIDWHHMVSDLVVVIGDPSYWGFGLATEAIETGNRVAFEKYGMRKLSGAIAAENVGSIKCYKNAEWVIEGRLLGHCLINGKAVDGVLVSCFNPEYFDDYAGVSESEVWLP